MCDSIEKSPGEKVVKNQLGDCENSGEGDKGDKGDKGDRETRVTWVTGVIEVTG